MTLYQTIRFIEMVASSQPSVNMIVESDIFRLNSYADAKYGVFGWLQGQHTTSVDSSFYNLQFTFFYVDRLTSDQGNQLEIQSVGIQTLDNIIRKLDDYGIECTSSYSFNTFNQRFLDECAGVYCNVLFRVPVASMCPEAFGDFNEDFNEDFLIY